MSALAGARVAALMLFAEDTHAVGAWWAAAFGVTHIDVKPHPQGDFVERLLELGATRHRGPLVVDAGRSICQLRDPFGNVFGLDGPP